MTYALDTNIISYLLRPIHNPEVVKKLRAETVKGNDYVIPPQCYYETMWHLLRKCATTQLRLFQELYDNSATEIDMNEAEFHTAAEIKAKLTSAGLPNGRNDADIFIAAYCLVNGYPLVTNNVRDFQRVAGLELVNWKQ